MWNASIGVSRIFGDKWLYFRGYDESNESANNENLVKLQEHYDKFFFFNYFINKRKTFKEKFIGIVHVKDTLIQSFNSKISL